MNARPCIDSAIERQYLAEVDRQDGYSQLFDETRAQVCTELRALLVRAFDGEAVMLPRVVGSGLPGCHPCRVVYTYTLGEAIADATCEVNCTATDALRAMLLPGADLTFCLGTFREAVIEQYLDDVADDLTNVRLGL